MAPYAILIAVVSVVLMGALVYRSSVDKSEAFSKGYSAGYRAGMSDGFDRYKEITQFTLENSERRLTKDDDMMEQVALLNADAANTPPLEILMAHGVDRLSDLPRGVRESLGIKDDDDRSLEDLIK